MTVVRRVLDKKKETCMCLKRLAFAEYPGFHSLEMQSGIFFLQTVNELRHHNKSCRDLIKCCPIWLRVFRKIK